MLDFYSGTYDVVVVGAGHAGIEAALASARLGARTLCLTTSLDGIGNLPCNPSIGGTAKGQLVREIDALGGEMARAADATCLQFRMLNRGKGPAVFSPRAQSDRLAYRHYMRRALEKCENLDLAQGECGEVLVDSDRRVCGVRLVGGARYDCRAVVLATGTYLGAKTFTGEVVRKSGPDGMQGADAMTQNLLDLGISIRRFKTGTPSRVSAKSIDFSVMTPQTGDENETGFAFDRTEPAVNRVTCYLTYTNEKTHEIIRASLDRSPLYCGQIVGTGPRYCPSIEDKVVRFPDKERHQLFLEPCGGDTDEYYVQGMSSSLPEDVQRAFLRTIRGLEHVHILRPGYAIEYDCIDPLQLDHTLMLRDLPGLFCAGQICGSSGYEEAAGQGLVAGVNAVRWLRGETPFTLARRDGYIGTLIDDLVTRGTNEPYRMMTSRSEYRLVCRQDNADSRLMPKGYAIGLLPKERLDAMYARQEQVRREIERLRKTTVPPSARINAFLEENGTAPISLSGAKLAELMRRPELNYEKLCKIDDDRPPLPRAVREQVEIEIKYEGYIRRQMKDIEEQRRLEDRVLPSDIDYLTIRTLRTEARQKLQAVRPETLGQAERISGVSPADIGALMVYLSHREEQET